MKCVTLVILIFSIKMFIEFIAFCLKCFTMAACYSVGRDRNRKEWVWEVCSKVLHWPRGCLENHCSVSVNIGVN